MADGSLPLQQPRWQLVLSGGSNGGQVFPVYGDTLTIGRELYNDIALDDLHVSKNHARLTRQGDRLVIEDLHSVNGTLVNNTPITAPTPLQPNDVITVGPFNFRVTTEDVTRPATSRQPTRPYPPAGGRAWSKRRLWLAVAGVVMLALALAALAGGYWLLGRGAATAGQVSTATATPALNAPAITLNQAPPEDTELKPNQSVTVQATATDAAGITRMALWVNNNQVDQVVSQLAQDVPSMTAAFQWAAGAPGVYRLEIRAYNRDGRVNILPVTTVNVVGPATPAAAPTQTPTPTITPIPLPPTATATTAPTPSPTATPAPPTPTPAPLPAALTVNAAALNVRAGPGTGYSRLGQLPQGSQAEIVGQAGAEPDRWWQIRFAAAADGLGWVTADPALSTARNVEAVPPVATPPLPAPQTPLPTPTTALTVLRPPAGKTLLVVSNRSIINQPARLTLSGGKSVGGGQEIDVAANSEVQIVLEPDFYRALWSSPFRSFVRGVDFTAVAGKVRVMWIVPEDGLTGAEEYGELVISAAATAEPAATPAPATAGNYVAARDRALFVVSNRSLANVFAVVTVSGGSFGGGQEIKLDANTEIPLELAPGNYRVIWSTPGFTAGDEFSVLAGMVIQAWIIPEDKQVFRQMPGWPVEQVNN